MPPVSTSSIEETFQKRTKLRLGKTLYEGDGTLYALKDHPNKVVKIVYTSNEKWANKAVQILRYLQRTKNSSVVKIHKVGSFATSQPATTNPMIVAHTAYNYYYVMDKLQLMPRKGRERTVAFIRDTYEMGLGYSKEMPRSLRTFVDKAKKLKFHHGDIHGWNIMRNKRGSLKFVDLESFMWD